MGEDTTFNWVMGIMLALIFVATLLPIGLTQFFAANWSALGMDPTLVTLLTTLIPLGIIVGVVLYFLKLRKN